MTRTTVQNTALVEEAISIVTKLLAAENVPAAMFNMPGTPPQVLMAGDATAMPGLLMRHDPKAADHLAREAGFYIGLRDLDRAWIGINASGHVSMFFKDEPRAEDYPELLIIDFERPARAAASAPKAELPVKTWKERIDEDSFHNREMERSAVYMQAEIADLRAVLAQAAPVAPQKPVARVSHAEEGFADVELLGDVMLGDELYAAPAAAPAPADGWISVAERLPELREEVLVYCGYRTLGNRTDDKHDPENHAGWVIDFDNGMCAAITHWMPIAAAPAPEAQ